MRNGLVVVVLAACLGGCASGPTGSETLMDGVKPNVARLVIYRSSALGFAIQPNYVVDGRVVGSSQAGGFTACELTPGTHEVAVANMALSSNLFGGSEKVSVNLRAGGTTYLSASPQMGIVTPGQITLIEVTENQGRADVASLRQANSCAKA